MSEKNENVEQEVTEEIKKINEEKSELQKKQQELDDLTDRYKRILAEFENHKKRSQKEREGMYNSILGDVVEVMLPILDNLENAAKVEDVYKRQVSISR